MQRGPPASRQQGLPSLAFRLPPLHCSNTLWTHLQLHFCNVSLIADDFHHGLHLQADSCIADMGPGLQGSCSEETGSNSPCPRKQQPGPDQWIDQGHPQWRDRQTQQVLQRT